MSILLKIPFSVFVDIAMEALSKKDARVDIEIEPCFGDVDNRKSYILPSTVTISLKHP